MAYRERYFKRLDSARGIFMGTFRKNLDARLEQFLAGQAKQSTKDCVKRIVEESADRLLLMEMESLKDAFDELAILDEELDECRSIKAELDGIMDDRAKTALVIYEKARRVEAGDDNYAKCRKITAAGLMAASYLGLKEYEVSNQQEVLKR